MMFEIPGKPNQFPKQSKYPTRQSFGSDLFGQLYQIVIWILDIKFCKLKKMQGISVFYLLVASKYKISAYR